MFEVVRLPSIVSNPGVVENFPIEQKLGYNVFCVNPASQESRVDPARHLPRRVHSSRCHEHDTLIRASGSGQHRERDSSAP